MSLHPLAAIVSELDRFGIPHMLAGSFASTYHGHPRTTNDIDLVIDPSRTALDEFVRALDPDRFYVSAEAARTAYERRGQFNVVLLDSGWKADLILRKERPFSRAEFERREPAEIAGTPLFVATAEDTIVAKLEWARAGESERQLRDVVGILEVSGEGLDRAYIARWVSELGLEDLWDRASAEVERR
ncbi:MAG: hypothetical protein ABFS41_08880 [Myxococcota bacterium]